MIEEENSLEKAAAGENCRLCGGALAYKFSHLVLRRHHVKYCQCVVCGSLQTEHPYWLYKAYSSNLAPIDTGAVQRNLDNFVAVSIMAKIFKIRDVLDVGGGDGLLCRMLRDKGLNCFVNDKHAEPVYAQGYTKPDFAQPQLLLAFELFEHFANPQQELAALFALRPGMLVATTDIYRGQDRDWWYLAPDSGQHVFFYSEAALRKVAADYGYDLSLFRRGYIIFSRAGLMSPLKSHLLRKSLGGLLLKIARAILFNSRSPGVGKDFAAHAKAPGKTAAAGESTAKGTAAGT